MPTPNTELRRAREGRGWTQAQVAEQIRAAPFTVYRWEAGLSFPSFYYLQRLCQLFGCDAQTLGFAPLAAADTLLSFFAPGAAEATADRRLGRLPAGFGQRLAQARIRLQFSQEALAEGVGVSARSVIRWEQEIATPHPYYRERLCVLLKSTPQALFGVGQAETALPEAWWQVPYLRNRYFTGRDDLLNELHARLHGERQKASAQPQVLCGLGGIGKTQTALEYAYRFRSDYQAVLWVAAETQETMLADYRALAQLFELPEQDSTNPAVVRNAVKGWLQQHANWLLIFDNVEHLEVLQPFLPDFTSQGHVLITTRSQILGTLGVPLNLPTMTQEESALFLLRRARLLDREESLEAAPVEMQTQAQTLVALFDGFPLALDQAGAYLEETRCSLTDYRERYGQRRRDLLGSRGSESMVYPASVLATLSLAFAQVEHSSPEAADLLRLCSFLHAEAIPEAFLSLAGDTLGPQLHALADDPFLLDRAIKELRRYSLIQRDPETHLLSLHRIVQATLQERMEEAERKRWVTRLVDALLRIFPSLEQVIQEGGGVQARCQPYVPHALACAATIAELEIYTRESAELLYRVSYYFHLWGDLPQAFLLLDKALEIAITALGENHQTVAFYCNELAILSVGMKQYRSAEERFQQALAIRERLLGPEDPAIAEILVVFAGLLCQMGKYSQAEALAQRAFAIQAHDVEPLDYKMAPLLNCLGLIAKCQGRYTEAKQLLQQAIQTYEQTLGSGHFFVGASKKLLADIAFRQAQYPQAATLYQEALQLLEQRMGPQHYSTVAALMLALGKSYFAQKKYTQAEALYQKACLNCKKAIPPDVGRQATGLLYLAELNLVRGHGFRAKRYVQEARFLLGEPARLTQATPEELLHGLLLIGDRLVAQEERMQAHMCYQEVLEMAQHYLGIGHPLTLDSQSRLATVIAETPIPQPSQESA